MISIRDSIPEFCARMLAWVFSCFIDIGSIISRAASLSGSTDTVNDGALLSQIFSALKGSAETAIEALVPVGLALCMLFFLISLIELAMSERFTLEYFIKFLSKLVIGVAAVYNSKMIFSTFADFGNSLADLLIDFKFVTDETSSVDALSEHLSTQFKIFIGDQGAAAWIILLVFCLVTVAVMGLLSIVLVVVVYIICYSRVMELCIRGVFLPIACALLSDDGWRGAGGRYIRKFVAICAQGAVLVMIGNITSGILSQASMYVIKSSIENINISTDVIAGMASLFSTIGSLLTGIALMAGIGFAAVSMMFKSIGVVNDVFGG